MRQRSVVSDRLARAVLIGALLAPAAAGCAGEDSAQSSGEARYELRFSHVTSENTPKGRAALEFERLLEDRTEGRIQVEVFPDSGLYGDEDEMLAIQSGSVQMLAPSSSKFTKIAPELQVLDLPFLFDTEADVGSVLDPSSRAGRAIFANANLTSRNIKVLGLWDNGFKQLTGNRPITEPDSLAGMTFRIQPSDVLRSQFDAWGADTTAVAFRDLYSALERGEVDGEENTWSNIESQSLDDVQPYIVQSDHGYLGYVLVINAPFLASLPADLQQDVHEAAAEATAFNRRIAAALNDEARKAIESDANAQVTRLTEEQRRAFKQAVVPSVWEEYAEVIGPQLVRSLLAGTTQ